MIVGHKTLCLGAFTLAYSDGKCICVGLCIFHECIYVGSVVNGVASGLGCSCVDEWTFFIYMYDQELCALGSSKRPGE